MYLIIGKVISSIIVPYLMYVLLVLIRKGIPPKELYWIFDINESEIKNAEGLFEANNEAVFETIKMTFIFILVACIVLPLMWFIIAMVWPVLILMAISIFLTYKLKKR